MIQIVDIGEFASQGVTRPVLCQGEDGNDYFVKGYGAGRKALVAEWVGNRLGRLLNLPIPEFSLLQLQPHLAKFSADREKIAHLGIGTLFGSRRVAQAVELRVSDFPFIPHALRARILVFDWWVANADRVFIGGAGNPNLLWSEPSRQLVVIDHNLAFDPSLTSKFLGEHIFREDRKFWTRTFREETSGEFRQALSNLPKIWSELPDDWIDVECGLTLAGIELLLWRFERGADSFWKLE